MTDETRNGAPAEEIAIVTVTVTDGDGAALPPAPAPETEPEAAPEPEPIPLPETLEDLQRWEEAQEGADPDKPAPRWQIQNATDAARLMARVHHFARQKAFFTDPYTEEIKRLQAQIAHLQEEKAKIEAHWDGEVFWYRSSLEVWARLQNDADPSVKTIKLPYGSLKVRAQQPEWLYDEDTLVVWLQANRPELIRSEPVPNKVELKKLVKVEKGAAHDPETGETIPGISVVDRPAKFDLEVKV
jgi:hypothetical protein